MHALALIRYCVLLEAVELVTESHRAYLRELNGAGTLLASGPFSPRTGGAPLLRVSDDNAGAALDAVRNGDPFWRDGIANYELPPWDLVIGGGELDAH